MRALSSGPESRISAPGRRSTLGKEACILYCRAKAVEVLPPRRRRSLRSLGRRTKGTCRPSSSSAPSKPSGPRPLRPSLGPLRFTAFLRRAAQVKSLMLLLARLPSAARVDDFPRLAAFVRSFEARVR